VHVLFEAHEHARKLEAALTVVVDPGPVKHVLALTAGDRILAIAAPADGALL